MFSIPAPRRRRAAVALAVVLGFAGSSAAATRKTDVAENVIDSVVRPLRERAGFTTPRERDEVLCRRMAIDLTGLPPTPDEQRRACAGRTPQQMADYFMGKPHGPRVPDGSPPYVYVNRRRWADLLQYQANLNEGTTWWRYARELDALVGDLYAGRIGYDEFTRRALASPAFVRRFGIFDTNKDLVQIAAQAIRIFLGREASAPEADDLANLFRVWDTIHVGHDEAVRRYPKDCPHDVPGKHDPCTHVELGVRGDVCDGLAVASCRSSALSPPGAPAVEVAFSDRRLRNVAELGPSERAVLERVGALFVARREWAEAIVDRALQRYLGWWKRGLFVPDFEMPAVRDALVDKLARDHYDLRRLDREIVTSVLYTTAAALPGGVRAGAPLWAVGPTKPLQAEEYLDLIANALGKPPGGCDFRYVALMSGSYHLPGHWYPTFPLPDFSYATLAQGLGGCASAPRQDPGGVVAAFTRRTVAAGACPGALHPKSRTLDGLVDEALRTLGAVATSEERAALVAALAAGGHATASQTAADQLCHLLLSSSLLVFY